MRILQIGLQQRQIGERRHAVGVKVAGGPDAASGACEEGGEAGGNLRFDVVEIEVVGKA